ncbi:hypothetical protein K474DRAFT_1706000 [Panus rudis PR-1116 ss-1]|nr:hypothetical protein K474DRAFT_1706000 [Panus rudis PR-1116 ss-1]
MRFFSSLLTALPAALVAQAVVIARQSGVGSGGPIIAPTAGSTLAAGQEFPFEYGNTNICHSGYSQVHVYLTETVPAATDVNNGELADPLYDFGLFTIANFGLPPFDNQVPAALTAPELSGAPEDIFLAVVETFLGCPPDGHSAWGLSSTPVEYQA